MANFEITDPIYLVNKASSVDSLYGTYPSLQEAIDALTPLALPGRQFAVQETGQPVKLYVWQGVGVNPTPAGRTDFIPLAGTEEGRPITGTIKADSTVDRLLQVGEYEVEPSPENPIGIGKIGYVTMKEDSFSYLSTYRPDHDNIKVSQFLVGQHTTLNVPVISASYMDLDTGFTMGYTLSPDRLGRASFMIQADYITVNNDFTTVEPENKSILAQRSYVDAMQTKPTNWTNASQRFSGLVDKSGDTTFNQVAVFDSDGNLAKSSLTSSEAVKTVNGVEPDENGNIDVAESQIIKDDYDNLITEYVRDNPDKHAITGQRNIILSTRTFGSINVVSSDNFLHGRDHYMSGNYSAVFGTNHNVGGNYSTVFGYYHNVRGNYSTAFGNDNTVTGSYSSAFGKQNTVEGHYSVAFGVYNTVAADYSAAFGYGNDAGGDASFAMNYKNITTHSYESAFGSYNKAYRIDNGDAIPDDLRFSIGIGNGVIGDVGERMNALSVFKNGEAWFDELTVDKIENSKSNKVAVTKEYLDLRVPTPPETGTHVLKSVNGVVSWVAE